MIPELGFIALLLATFTSLLLAILPQIGIAKNNANLISTSWHFSYLFGIFTTISIAILAYSFAVDDFSLEYVAAHSNTQLPLFFKIAATWGGHEGSMLFWLFSLSVWLMLFAFFSRKIDPVIAARTLSVLGLICLGLAIFILYFSNPFIRQFPLPPEGRDLNPMLQDVGLIFHPPLLYLGYVGFAVSFALTVSALLSGHLDAAMARWMRPWALVSWLFLTLGIVLGAWWAYYELGWGGWWFWDPVENASLMPWLLGTALIHSLVVSEQRGIFNYWTSLLAIFTFALSLLGTFIVRSGVLTSVHAFAVDAERGIAILILFFSLSFIALALFALRARFWQGEVQFRLLSKESAFLLLNGLFVVATVVVVLGTFYPMIFSAMNWGSISVGAPYFNLIFTPITLLLMLVMGIAVSLRWKQIERRALIQRTALIIPSLAIALGIIAHIQTHPVMRVEGIALLFITLAIWLILNHLPYLPKMWQLRPLAMRTAHIGFALCVIGAMMNSYYGDEKGVRLKEGDRAELAGYHFHYREFNYELGQNYTAEVATIALSDRHNQTLSLLKPERRHYDVRTMTMAEVGLFHALLDDIYIVMGDKLGKKEYAFRLHYKPYVRLLWLGGAMMIFASLLAIVALFRQHRRLDGGKK